MRGIISKFSWMVSHYGWASTIIIILIILLIFYVIHVIREKDDVVSQQMSNKASSAQTIEKEKFVSAQQASDVWTCSCGYVNHDKFCIVCGKQKPEVQELHTR